MTQKRKRLSGPEKIAIVKRYLVERVPISDLCDEYGLQPSQIYRWQAAIFEHGADVFDLKKGRYAKAAESDKDADGVADEIVSITTQANLRQEYRYAGTWLESIEDFAGRVTSVSVVGGNLMQITEPDPGSNQPGASSRVSGMPARCSGSTASPTPRARPRGSGMTPTSCTRVNDYRSQVAWLQARSSPDASEHSRADLFTFVECEHVIGPAGSRQHPMRPAGLPLD